MPKDTGDAQDYSMLSRRWSGDKLITSEIAMQMARLVHKRSRGQTDLERNEPLSILEDGDSWVVSGSKPGIYDPANPVLDGPLRMRISQYDGQILSYLDTIELPLSAPPKPNEE